MEHQIFLTESTKKELKDINEILSNPQQNIFGEEEPEIWEEIQEPNQKAKKEQSPYTKQLVDKLKTKGRGNKLTKEQALHMYKGAGGNDPQILNSKYVKTIESAYNKLIKNK